MTGAVAHGNGSEAARYRERSRRGSELSRIVKSTRERINASGGNPPEFDYELALMYARTRQSASYAIPVFAIIVAAMLSLGGEKTAALAWLLATLCTHALVLLLSRRFESLERADVRVNIWRRKFALVEFVNGVAWGCLILLPTYAIDGPAVEIFQFATMLTVIAVGTMLASNLPVAMVAGTLPISGMLAFSFGLHGDKMYIAMAIMALGAQMFFLVLSSRVYRTTQMMLEYRVEKDDLIAELEQAKAISDEARRRAEEANLAKSRFLATMSHELRTPLNAILGFSEVLKSEIFGPLPNDQYREYASDIHSSGNHLLNLINEILDLSRIEAGRYTLNEETVALNHIADDCCNLLQLKTRNKNITVTQQFEPNLPKLWADERAVRQIILNLLSNAIKFTPTDGKIFIKVGWTAGGGQYVTIRDTGPGIPEEEIPVVLSAFGQGSLAIKTAEQGTGLGLPIVQALVKMHGGSFDLKSKLREGTEVTVTFPSIRVMEVLAPISEDEDDLPPIGTDPAPKPSLRRNHG